MEVPNKFEEEGDFPDDYKKALPCGMDQIRFEDGWVDITEDFFDLAKCLKLGELLHDDVFGLVEAMSAIEMMDPKMDAGMLCNRGNKVILTFDSAVESGALKLEGLTVPEQIGIIDETLACLVSWLEGHTLAQTVFTNLYLHRPHQIEDRPLKAFCIATYKLVDVIKGFINLAAVYEEEDYQPMLYGYRLVPEVTDQRAIGMLKEVEEELNRRLRGKGGKEDVCDNGLKCFREPYVKYTFQNVIPAEISGALIKVEKQSTQQNELVALLARIKFTRFLYQTLSTLFLTDSREVRTPDVDVNRLLPQCAEQLSHMQRTINLGFRPQESDKTMIGFEPLVNQRLLPPTFPRYTKIKSREEALEYYEKLLVRLKVVSKIYSHTSFHSALDFFIEFSRHGPCILSRSVLQVLYMPQLNRILGTTYVVDVLRDAARSFICPPSLANRSILLSTPQARDYVENFLKHCSRPFIQLIQLCGHNRARQRDKLAHLLQDFAELQDEAERVDAYLHNLSVKLEWQRSHLACFGTWILYHTLRIMVMYLLSGFELELYSVHEYMYIFWYLYEFLYAWLVSSIKRADTFLMEQETLSERENSGRGRKKNKLKKKKGGRAFDRDIILCQALQNMCGGYYKAMMGFHRSGKVNLPKAKFDSEKVRYEHRFAPFKYLSTPPAVHYLDFHDALAPGLQQPSDVLRMYVNACKHFHQARCLLEAIPNPDQEINDILLVAKTNFVVLKLLAGGHKEDSTTPPEFDFGQHQHFPIIKLV